MAAWWLVARGAWQGMVEAVCGPRHGQIWSAPAAPSSLSASSSATRDWVPRTLHSGCWWLLPGCGRLVCAGRVMGMGMGMGMVAFAGHGGFRRAWWPPSGVVAGGRCGKDAVQHGGLCRCAREVDPHHVRPQRRASSSACSEPRLSCSARSAFFVRRPTAASYTTEPLTLHPLPARSAGRRHR